MSVTRASNAIFASRHLLEVPILHGPDRGFARCRRTGEPKTLESNKSHLEEQHWRILHEPCPRALYSRQKSACRYERKTPFPETKCGIVYRANYISLYILRIKYASPPLCFLPRPPCRLWYDGDAQASSDRASGKEETGWTLSRSWIR
jgi:hypothetical protein